MALTPEQRNILAQIKRIGAQRGASPKEIKAAIETGLVESNLSNPAGGTADSGGWRQERRSLYKDPTNVAASINRFFDETGRVRSRYARAGDLAAAVQRPAAQYRGRYQGVSGRAAALMGMKGSAPGVAASAPSPAPGVDNSQARRAAIAQFLGDKNADPVDFAMQVRSLKDTPATTTTTRAPRAPRAAPASTGGSVGTFGNQKVAGWIAPILDYARRNGWQGTVTSGYRSYADQQRIYNSGVRPAAKPGTSNHEFTAFPGGAVDVSNAAQLARILAKSPYAGKLVWAGAKDPVHFSHPRNGSY